VGRISIIVAIPESIGTLVIVFFIAQTLGFTYVYNKHSFNY
jgi:hypothetical protein